MVASAALPHSRAPNLRGPHTQHTHTHTHKRNESTRLARNQYINNSQKGLEVCYCLWGVPSRPSPGSYLGPVQVPSRVRGGPVQIRHVLCFTVFRTHPGPEVRAIPARPGPILLPSVPYRIGPGRAETDFLATSEIRQESFPVFTQVRIQARHVFAPNWIPSRTWLIYGKWSLKNIFLYWRECEYRPRMYSRRDRQGPKGFPQKGCPWSGRFLNIFLETTKNAL